MDSKPPALPAGAEALAQAEDAAGGTVSVGGLVTRLADDDPPPQCGFCGLESGRHLSGCMKAGAEAHARTELPAKERTEMENEFIREWNDAVGCASVWTQEGQRWAARVTAAGEALRKDYLLAIQRANREARLAVALRMKLEEVAGPEVASAVVVADEA